MLLENFKVIDLTHTLSSKVPTWNGSCGFCLEVKQDYDKMFRVQKVNMHAGVGTHMDAPSHRIEGGISISDIPLENLISPACVIDVSKKADADYEISGADIEEYEQTHGAIPKGALVIGYTGWSRFWDEPDAYRNLDAKEQMHFPSFSAQAAELLLKREIHGIAIDTLSPDCPNSDYPVHKLILGAGKYIVENIANGSKLPPKGSYVISLHLKAEDATESPIRIIGLIPS
jgi:kynurenine formamidase